MKHKYIITFLLFVLILSISGMGFDTLTMTTNQEKDAVAYNKAYRLIMEEEWNLAVKALDDFIKTFPTSPYIDDAHFWKCYIREEQDDELEIVFDCYKHFLGVYPTSKWIDDAHKNMTDMIAKTR